jgi:hypothetical protein
VSDDCAVGDSWLETMRLVESAQRDAGVLCGTSEIKWCVWSKDREHTGL